jgi:hypothetical protein
VPCATLSPPPSPSPVKGEGIEEGESLPEIALVPCAVNTQRVPHTANEPGKPGSTPPNWRGNCRAQHLAGGSTSQHDVPGQFHMPVVLGEFFVTLN